MRPMFQYLNGALPAALEESAAAAPGGRGRRV